MNFQPFSRMAEQGISIGAGNLGSIVRADERLTVFIELESAIRAVTS
jgi:hypothetical protein